MAVRRIPTVTSQGRAVLMRDQFPGYFPPRPDEFAELWQDGLVVLDTNALLNLYRYSTSTRSDFLDILQELDDRVWIPNHVAFEFLRRRRDVIREQKNALAEIRKKVEAAHGTIVSEINRLQRLSAGADLEADAVQSRDQLLKSIDERQDEDRQRIAELVDDPILEKLDALVAGRVGEPYDESELEVLHEEIQKRYDENVPPGYADAKKNVPDRYGDCIIWMQILDHAGATNSAVIFVTDDQKDDWWDRPHGETLGPRPELVHEFMAKVGKRVHLYRPERFMDEARERLNIAVSNASVAEAEKVSADRETDRREAIKTRIELEMEMRRLQEELSHARHPSSSAKYARRLEQLRTSRRHLLADLARVRNEQEHIGGLEDDFNSRANELPLLQFSLSHQLSEVDSEIAQLESVGRLDMQRLVDRYSTVVRDLEAVELELYGDDGGSD